jgi:hypothetical protein
MEQEEVGRFQAMTMRHQEETVNQRKKRVFSPLPRMVFSPLPPRRPPQQHTH